MPLICASQLGAPYVFVSIESTYYRRGMCHVLGIQSPSCVASWPLKKIKMNRLCTAAARRRRCVCVSLMMHFQRVDYAVTQCVLHRGRVAAYRNEFCSCGLWQVSRISTLRFAGAAWVSQWRPGLWRGTIHKDQQRQTVLLHQSGCSDVDGHQRVGAKW